MQDIWKDIFDSNPMGDIEASLRDITKLCDKQAFGMVRPEHTRSIRETLAIVRRKLNNFEESLPKEPVEVDVHVNFVKGVVKLLEDNKHGSHR